MINLDWVMYMKLSLVVPCYNEEENIELFYKEVVKTFKKSFKYEIIFINDGSKDKTISILKELYKSKKENIKIVNLSRNFGKESGIYAGLKQATGDFTCIIDADLQQNPSFVLDMLKILEDNEEYDSVAAFQETRKEGKLLTFLKNCFYRLINKICEIEFVSGASDFRLFRKNVVESILEMTEYYRFSKGIFSWVGFNTYYMPYTVEDRANGTSKWKIRQLFKYAIDGIVSFTTTPLRISTILGLIISLISFAYFVLVIIQKLFLGVSLEGYTTIVALILLLGGIQLLCLGIIGEYLARTYVEVKRRPIYITKEILDNSNK